MTFVYTSNSCSLQCHSSDVTQKYWRSPAPTPSTLPPSPSPCLKGARKLFPPPPSPSLLIRMRYSCQCPVPTPKCLVERLWIFLEGKSETVPFLFARWPDIVNGEREDKKVVDVKKENWTYWLSWKVSSKGKKKKKKRKKKKKKKSYSRRVPNSSIHGKCRVEQQRKVPGWFPVSW